MQSQWCVIGDVVVTCPYIALRNEEGGRNEGEIFSASGLAAMMEKRPRFESHFENEICLSLLQEQKQVLIV